MSIGSAIFVNPPMNTGPYRIKPARFAKLSAFRPRLGQAQALAFWRGLFWASTVIVVDLGVWVLAPAHGQPVRQDLVAVQSEPAVAEPGPAPTVVRTQDAAEVDRLRISSQTWRRGGLGSKALVTFTLRNDNDYPVKDVEVSCSFNGGDGSHLMDLTRVLRDTVNGKSRKTFARVLVGFISINASQAKCSLVAARRA